jgi:hypothetical protein
MKTHMRKGVLLGVVFAAASLVAVGQNQYASNIEVPGDHFSLEGALELFKKSSSPEEFERLLNVPDSKVNNLDLNGDRQIDYIKVIDRYDRNVHAFILQAVISERELQDIAVITLEKQSDGRATLQLVGDADIYGVETIIEPTEEVRVYAGTTTTRNVVNVWTWPVVRYVYAPHYSVWISPWGWYSRPVWWYPWRPVTYVVYRPYWDSYTPYYSRCYYHRNIYAQRIYVPVRSTSVIVYNRHHDNVVRSRNTRGRDYDRDGYYRGDERARYARDARVHSYDNSRDYTRRDRSAGYDNNGDDNSSDGNRPERSNYNRGRDERNNSNDHESSTSVPNDRGNNGSNDRGNNGSDRTNVNRGRDERNNSNNQERSVSVPNVRSTNESRPSFSAPRETRENNSRPRVEVSRGAGTNERRQTESAPRVRSSQGEGNTSGARIQSPPQQRHESPRVSSPGSSQRDRGAATGSSSGSPKKRGRD